MTRPADRGSTAELEVLSILAAAAGHELRNCFAHQQLCLDALDQRSLGQEERAVVAALEKNLERAQQTTHYLQRLLASWNADRSPIHVGHLLHALQRRIEDELPDDLLFASEYAPDLWLAGAPPASLYDAGWHLISLAGRQLVRGVLVVRAENRDRPEDRRGRQGPAAGGSVVVAVGAYACAEAQDPQDLVEEALADLGRRLEQGTVPTSRLERAFEEGPTAPAAVVPGSPFLRCLELPRFEAAPERR